MPDRRYRQKGYQDSTPTGRGGGQGPSDERPQRLEGAPKGRGAERDRAEVFRCKACGEKNDSELAAGAVCKKCGADLHACSQCAHFDSMARYQCRKPIPAAIPAKSRRNDCAFFAPAITLDLRVKSSSETRPDTARSAFDKLFGKK